MKRITSLVFLTLTITGCTADNQDLVDYINDVKGRKTALVESVPDMESFVALHYSETGARNPFSNPRPESVKAETSFPQNCPQPNFARIKGPLETYSLDNLNMHGTLGSEKLLWGLIRASTGEIFRVSPGDYMGLNHGEILDITKHYIELSELILTGKGCWKVRTTQIHLSSQGNS
ncbi:pilus assembly protein PilP [Moritella yayanosii]|uniref:Putative Type IV pilus biogenesis protein PilP n=1 Tax=Moritella yayanosii TaxID=69539 RepID=A0A330LS85_9GAMM|nr:pilus assembly protein PilP [Moritella yayanosii]SQD79817.1 putative Type IV pilus biogenesis protein PilP [Moritella yayanosii]